MKKEKKKFRFPIRAKTTVMILVFGFLIAEVAMVFFSIRSARHNEQDCKDNATSLALTVSHAMDGAVVKDLRNQIDAILDQSAEKPLSDEWGSERWNAYIAQYESIAASESFKAMKAKLGQFTVDNAPQNVSSVYVVYVSKKYNLFVYICDGAKTDACPPGCLDPIYDVNKAVLDDPTRGFPAYITNTAEYGWLVTAGKPIYDGTEVVGYATVDISMTAVRANQANSIVTLFLFLMGGVLVVSVLGILVIQFTLFKPVLRMKAATDAYAKGDLEESHKAFQELSVGTRDELEDLADSMKLMESDIHDKIRELTVVNDELRASQQETARMTELANKDALTGVRNKVAYDSQAEEIDLLIKEGKAPAFGLAMIDLNDLKVINDDYGHRSGDEALVKLATIICAIFAHSPVFRYGGDEFVVFLKSSDYRNAKKLVKEFEEKIGDLAKDEELSQAEKISAAIGYFPFDPEKDKCIADLFKRADEAMYANKRAMKAKHE